MGCRAVVKYDVVASEAASSHSLQSLDDFPTPALCYLRRNKAIIALLRKGIPWSTVMKSTGAARGTVAKLAKRLAEKKRAA
jgi:hypothetical protein